MKVGIKAHTRAAFVLKFQKAFVRDVRLCEPLNLVSDNLWNDRVFLYHFHSLEHFLEVLQRTFS